MKRFDKAYREEIIAKMLASYRRELENVADEDLWEVYQSVEKVWNMSDDEFDRLRKRM